MMRKPSHLERSYIDREVTIIDELKPSYFLFI